MGTIMVENDAYSEILNYDGNNGMEIALVTGLMICLTGIGLYAFFIYKTCIDCRKHNYQDMLEIREASRAAVRQSLALVREKRAEAKAKKAKKSVNEEDSQTHIIREM